MNDKLIIAFNERNRNVLVISKITLKHISNILTSKQCHVCLEFLWRAEEPGLGWAYTSYTVDNYFLQSNLFQLIHYLVNEHIQEIVIFFTL